MHKSINGIAKLLVISILIYMTICLVMIY